MAKANPVDVEHFLEKLSFPANKNTLVKNARDANASEGIITALETMPDREYHDNVEAAKATYSPDVQGPMGLDSCDD